MSISLSHTRLAALIGLVLSVALSAPAGAAGPSMAVEVATGRVIEHNNAFQRWYPASLTKLMTAYVAFRAVRAGRISLDTDIVMTPRAADEPASKMYFKPGTRFPLDSALKYLMVKSANDVAVAIAQAVGGSLDGFVATMNAEAWRIGMTSSRFVNPNGLPGEGQYTTARDMALLAVTLRREFPEYASYFDLEGFEVGGRTYENYNILIGRFEGANGMKTGYICASGFNQVSSASRDGRTVVAVVFGADSQVSRAEESARLLDKALRTPADESETLLTLEPYGAERATTRDVSEEICSPEAQEARRGERDEDGELVFNSPLIKGRGGPPEFVPAPLGEPIGDGPATALEAAAVLGTRGIPLPVYKPSI
nr:D-alanyl-D-alanine carboxypeptidase family protein [Pseudohoeflea sp. DP4N28-3]